jgi:hypothetical protein
MPKEVTASVSSLIDLKAELFRKQTLKKAQEASAGAVDTKRLFVKGSGKVIEVYNIWIISIYTESSIVDIER